VSAVFVIDREPAIRLAARSALERAGFSVTTAADDGAVAAAPPDLLLADPVIASLAMLRRRYPAARMLALSADGDAPRDNLPILRKPFTTSQLLAAVRLCLARSGR